MTHPGGSIAALPLWQPWATLVAIGAKRVETRHWACPPRLIGMRVAIHATKTRDHLAMVREPFFDKYRLDPELLPLGALVATTVIDRCIRITEVTARALEEQNPQEFAFGLYEPGRFAWVLRDTTALHPTIPRKGSQGIFNVPVEALGWQAPQQVLDVA